MRYPFVTCDKRVNRQKKRPRTVTRGQLRGRLRCACKSACLSTPGRGEVYRPRRGRSTHGYMRSCPIFCSIFCLVTLEAARLFTWSMIVGTRS